MSTSLLLRLTYAVCLLGGAATHVAVLVSHGLSWDYGGVPMLTRVFWASLAFLDPLAALLLLVRPRIGLSLTLAIITSDVVHNTWVEWWISSWFEPVGESVCAGRRGAKAPARCRLALHIPSGQSLIATRRPECPV